MRNKYKSKKKAPKNMKWVFSEDWTKGIKLKDLPYKVKENYLLNFNEFINESYTKSPSIKIVEKQKSSECFDFISKYLTTMDFNSYMNNPDLYQVGAYDLEDLVGLSIFKMKDNKIHLNYGLVDSNYRGKGINRKMKLEIIKIGRENKCQLITANVRESNLSSLISLKSLGFKINDQVDFKYSDGEKKIPLYLYLNSNESISNILPDGEYDGFIKGYEIYSDNINFKSYDLGLKNVVPIKCRITCQNGLYQASSKAGNFYNSKEAREYFNSKN